MFSVMGSHDPGFSRKLKEIKINGFCIEKFQPPDTRLRGPFIFKNFCFFLNSTQSWRPEGFGTIFSYCLLLFLHVKIFRPIMENSQVAQKINTSIKHVVPKNQNFRSLFSIFQDGLKLGGKKTVINFFGLGSKKNYATL